MFIESQIETALPCTMDCARARQHQKELAKAHGLAHIGDDAIGVAAELKRAKEKARMRGN